MDEKFSSALNGIKNLSDNANIKDTISQVSEKVKDVVGNIDLKDAVDDIKESYAHGGVKEALGCVAEKIKEASTHSDNVNQSLRDNPGAAINAADNNKVNPEIVKEEVRNLNNNPRNSGN